MSAATKITHVRLSVRAIAADLRAIRAFGAKNRPTGDSTLDVEVRLQVLPDGDWCLHTGDAIYDTDHSGVFGADSIPLLGSFDSMAMARTLINQAVDMAVDGEGLNEGIVLHYAGRAGR